MGLKVNLPKQVRVQVDGSTGWALKLVHDWLPLAIMAAYTVQQLHGQAFLAVGGPPRSRSSVDRGSFISGDRDF